MQNIETLFIGTYTENILFGTGEILVAKGGGIPVLSLSPEGKLKQEALAPGVRNPSYVCVSADKKNLYCVNELKEFEGKASGGVSAFAVESGEEGISLRYLNSRPTGGTDPCHIAINRGKTHIYASNFMSGSVCAVQVEPDGSLGGMSDFKQFEGKGRDPKRQASPHAHSLVFSPDEKFAFVPDLGTDRVMIYRTDFEKGGLLPHSPEFYPVDAGFGPRFCEFHPNGRWCYLINELASSVSALEYDPVKGGFKTLATVPTIPSGFTGDNICADLHITPDGKFLYASNRGHHSLAAFEIDGGNGSLRHIGNLPCGGKTPRCFAVSLSGKYLIAANQDTDNILSYRIESDGLLTPVDEIGIGTPVCVRPVIL